MTTCLQFAKRITSAVKKNLAEGAKIGISLTLKKIALILEIQNFDTIHLLVKKGFKVCVSDPNLPIISF